MNDSSISSVMVAAGSPSSPSKNLQGLHHSLRLFESLLHDLSDVHVCLVKELLPAKGAAKHQVSGGISQCQPDEQIPEPPSEPLVIVQQTDNKEQASIDAKTAFNCDAVPNGMAQTGDTEDCSAEPKCTDRISGAQNGAVETGVKRASLFQRPSFTNRSFYTKDLHADAKKHHMCTMTGVVKHWLFDVIAGCVIVVNSGLIAFETEWLATHLSTPMSVEILNYICTAYFILELYMRIYVHRMEFIQKNTLWNALDTILVVSSIVEISIVLFIHAGHDAVQSVKTLQMFRIFRVGRLMRFSHELSALMMMIVESLKALYHAIIMLALVVFVFSVFFTATSSWWLKKQIDTHSSEWHSLIDHSNSTQVQEIYGYFGSLPKSAYTLIQAMLGGIEWGYVSDALAPNPGAAFLFLAYIFFAMLAVLNIVTGVFVDKAVNMARSQRDYIIEQDRVEKERYAEELRNTFEELDANGDHRVGLSEIQQVCNMPATARYFEAMGFTAHDCVRLHNLLDDDASGMVDLQEFVDGCLLLKGNARSIDVHAILVQCRRIQSCMRALMVKSGLDDHQAMCADKG